MSEKTLAQIEFEKAARLSKQARDLVAEHPKGWSEGGEEATQYEKLVEAALFHRERANDMSRMAEFEQFGDADKQLREDLQGMVGTGEADAEVVQDNVAQKLREWANKNAPRMSSESIEFRQSDYLAYRDFVVQGGTAKEWVTQAPVSVGTATAGGNTVPTRISSSYWENLYRINGIRSAGARVLTTEGGEPIHLPKSEDADLAITRTTDISTIYTPESGTADEAQPTTSVVALEPKKFLRYTRMTREIAEDSATDIEGMIGRQLGRTAGKAMEAAYALGDGTSGATGEPDGWNNPTRVAALSGAANVRRITASSSTQISYDNIVDLVYAVDDYGNWADNCLLFHKKIVGNLLKLKGSDGHPLFSMAIYAGGPENMRDSYGTILGYDVKLATYCGDSLATSDDIVGMFGPPDQYAIRDVDSVEIRRWDQARYLQDEVDYTVRFRTDGKFLNSENFSWIKAVT